MYFTMYANSRGEVIEHPGLEMLGRSGGQWISPAPDEMIPLPRGASLVSLPGFLPVGISVKQNTECLETEPVSGEPVLAVAALLPQGFTRTLLPACVSPNQNKMPLLGYAAIGFKNGKIYVAAVQSDEHKKWHPVNYNTEGLPARVQKLLKRYPDNRIYRQLAHCSLHYGCFTAQNIFYQRWEGGIPTMKNCNANCLGCISENHVGNDSPQQRLRISPTVQEITQVGREHLARAADGIISFGQGCEGEPALNADKLAAAIRGIRKDCDQGSININTNAGFTRGIRRVCDAGLDSMRVTIFSCVKDHYNEYHRPRSYSLENVQESISYAKDKGLYVSVNLLVFPGFTDRPEEIDALLEFARSNRVDMIQLRNLNFDPDILLNHFPPGGNPVGITEFLAILQQELPEVRTGSYSLPYSRV
ncbi:radical SAM protein [Syntrophomonas palmitatica]|uniref:radical SAM protein n=1 Tax=Syntrophomonas palmitatica TaxID=402877 RepID=UPI0006D04836|nr:radical SAM protein [Syntrophomonas palmitatica]